MPKRDEALVRERDTAILRYHLMGYTVSQIAAFMEISYSWARVLVNRVREKYNREQN